MVAVPQNHMGTRTLEADPSVGTSLRAFSASDAGFSNVAVTPSGSTGHALRQSLDARGPMNGSQSASPSSLHPAGIPLVSST